MTDLQIQSKQVMQAWRLDLKTQQQALETAFFEHQNTAKLLKQQSLLIDQLLKKIWLQANINNDISLIAVEGIPSSSVSKRIFFNATISPETLSRAL